MKQYCFQEIQENSTYEAVIDSLILTFICMRLCKSQCFINRFMNLNFAAFLELSEGWVTLIQS